MPTIKSNKICEIRSIRIGGTQTEHRPAVPELRNSVPIEASSYTCVLLTRLTSGVVTLSAGEADSRLAFIVGRGLARPSRTFSSMCDHGGRRFSADGAPAGRRQYRALCHGRGQHLLQARDALALGRRGRIAGADDGTRALQQLHALVGLAHHRCERLDRSLTLQQQHEELVADQRLVLAD